MAFCARPLGRAEKKRRPKGAGASSVGVIQMASTRLLGQPASRVSTETKDKDQGRERERPFESRFIVLCHMCLHSIVAALPVSREAPPCLTVIFYSCSKFNSRKNVQDSVSDVFFCEFSRIILVKLFSRESCFTSDAGPYMTQRL
jgi:hypothetical protein